MLDYGMRTENMILKGIINQRNPIHPDVPSIYELFNLVRAQWILALDGPGGLENPLNYTLLELSDTTRTECSYLKSQEIWKAVSLIFGALPCTCTY